MTAHQATFPLPVFVVFLLLHVATIGLIAAKSPFPTDIDEHDHFSYVFHVDGDARLMPDYDAMRLVDLDNPSVYTDRRNVMSHPPYYYLLMSTLVDPGETTLTGAVTRLRLANMLLSGAAVALILIAGFRLVEQPEARFVFAVGVVLCPKIGVMGGMINNDNLALLGGAIVFAGFVGMAKARPTVGSACLIGGGFVVAAAAKLTAGLVLGFLIVFAHLPLANRLLRLDRDVRTYAAVLLALMAVGMAPYVANLVVYGTPHYIGKAMYPIPEHGFVVYEPIAYVIWFIYGLVQSWATFETDLLDVAALVTVLGLAFWGAWRAGPGTPAEDRAPGTTIAIASLASLLCVLLINIVFTYTVHRATGYPYGMYFRYYLPIWPGVILGGALAVAAMARPAARIATAFAVLALMLYSHTAPLVSELVSGWL